MILLLLLLYGLQIRIIYLLLLNVYRLCLLWYICSSEVKCLLLLLLLELVLPILQVVPFVALNDMTHQGTFRR